METAPNPVETVLPRPAQTLPTPALAPATRKLADKLCELFSMSDDAAMAFALATVDPSSARKAAESPERLPVPGGIVYGVRTEVWSQFVMPDPRNPRVGPSRRHPASTLVGHDEATRFRPIPEPMSSPDGAPHLILGVENQEHLAWAAMQAQEYVLSQNDWRDSIRHQGVMTEVWLTAVRFENANGTPSMTVPVTAEGSSRLTAVHYLTNIRSADVPYVRDERKLRSYIRKLNEALDAAGDPDHLEVAAATQMRCAKVPALLLVGFEAHGGIAPDFGAAVKSLVALRHVDYPKPWGEATENEALGDAVIAELERRQLITSGKADWLAGSLTPDEATAHGFSDDPGVRAATIVRIMTSGDVRIHEAVRVAITSQSTRKRIGPKLLLDIASSLILRSLPEEDSRKRERTRRYLKEAYSVHLAQAREWDATFRSGDEIAAAALVELETDSPGPATRELAARSAYPLIVGGALTGDRGTQNNDQEDRRKPGEVIERMRTVKHGVHQLRRAVVDFEEGRRPRMVAEDGSVVITEDGRESLLRDADLRRSFSPAGQPSPLPAPQTAAELLQNELSKLGLAVQNLADCVKGVEAIRGEDGLPAIDVIGAEAGDCAVWRDTLLDLVMRKLPLWEQRHTMRHGRSQYGDVDEFDDSNEEDLDDDEFVLEDGGFADLVEDSDSLDREENA